MASHLINFRDKGCQGAMDIFRHALNLAKNTTTCNVKEDFKDIEIALVSQRTSKNIEQSWDYWKEAALLLGIPISVFSENASSVLPRICIFDTALLRDISDDLPYTIIAQGIEHDTKSYTAVAALTSLVYHCLKLNKDISELHIAWIGSAGADYSALASAYIQSSLCSHNTLSIAFPETTNPTLDTNLNAPDADILDFALRAGSKIFLTHEPHLIDTDIDILFLTYWQYPQTKEPFSNKHPFIKEKMAENLSEHTHIISFISDIPSTEFDVDLYSKAAVYTRVACLQYILDTQKQ